MAGFEALYKQTVTLFNRIKGADGETLWYPTILRGVHLIDSHSSTWNNQGEDSADNAELRVLFKVQNGRIMVAGKPYFEPKRYRLLAEPQKAITFSFGHNDDFDFFVEGALDEFKGSISDEASDRHGFYNWMNKKYDGVYAISAAAKYNLLPHFVITAR